MRLIDVDALYDKLYENMGEGEVLDRIPPCYVDDAPTVDAVPVVRCRDCVYAEKQESRLFCHIWRLVNGHGDAGYCCYGERKEDENGRT